MWAIILVLIGLGLLMVLLEILIIPGGGFAGILGFGMMAIGIYLSFSREGINAGFITLGVTLVLNIAALMLALRSKTWDKAMLKTNIDAKVNVIEVDKVRTGDTGLTISRCAPSGKALINDEYYEVHARSEFIEEEQKIEVIKIEGNKIIIKKI